MNSAPLSGSSPRRGNGSDRSMSSRASWTHRWALFAIARTSVHPVATQVRSSVWQNSPVGFPPSWATRSTSQNPGERSSRSANGPDRDLPAEQGAGFRPGPAPDPEAGPLRGEGTVDRGGGDPQELLPHVGLEGELSVAFERLDRLGHERGQALAGGPVRCRPDLEWLDHVRAVGPLPRWARRLRRGARRFPQGPAGVPAGPAGELAQLVEHPRLALLRGPRVALGHLPRHRFALRHR
jgi:hypothetical protein